MPTLQRTSDRLSVLALPPFFPGSGFVADDADIVPDLLDVVLKIVTGEGGLGLLDLSLDLYLILKGCMMCVCVSVCL